MIRDQDFLSDVCCNIKVPPMYPPNSLLVGNDNDTTHKSVYPRVN